LILWKFVNSQSQFKNHFHVLLRPKVRSRNENTQAFWRQTWRQKKMPDMASNKSIWLGNLTPCLTSFFDAISGVKKLVYFHAGHELLASIVPKRQARLQWYLEVFYQICHEIPIAYFFTTKVGFMINFLVNFVLSISTSHFWDYITFFVVI